MKTVIDALPEKVKMDLVDLYESSEYKSFKKLLDAIRMEIAKDCLAVPKDRLEMLQGKAEALKALHLTLKHNYKKNKDMVE